MQVAQLILSNNIVQNVVRVPGIILWVPRSLERQSMCACVFLGAGGCDWRVICVPGFLKAGALYWFWEHLPLLVSSIYSLMLPACLRYFLAHSSFVCSCILGPHLWYAVCFTHWVVVLCSVLYYSCYIQGCNLLVNSSWPMVSGNF